MTNLTHIYRIEPVGDPATYAFRVDQKTDTGNWEPCGRHGIAGLFADSPTALAAINKHAPDARRIELPFGHGPIVTGETWLFRIVVFSLKRYPGVTEHILQQHDVNGQWRTISVTPPGADMMVIWSDYDTAQIALRAYAERHGMGEHYEIDVPLCLGLPVSMRVEDWVNANQPKGEAIFSRFAIAPNPSVPVPMPVTVPPAAAPTAPAAPMVTKLEIPSGTFKVNELTNGQFHVVRWVAPEPGGGGKYWRTTSHPTTVGKPFHDTREEAEQWILAYGRALAVAVTLLRNRPGGQEMATAFPGASTFPRLDDSGLFDETQEGGLCEQGHDFTCLRCGKRLCDHKAIDLDADAANLRLDSVATILHHMRGDSVLSGIPGAVSRVDEALAIATRTTPIADVPVPNRFQDGRHAIATALSCLEALDYWCRRYGEGPNGGESHGNALHRADAIQYLKRHPQRVTDLADQRAAAATQAPHTNPLAIKPTEDPVTGAITGPVIIDNPIDPLNPSIAACAAELHGIFTGSKPVDERDDPIDEGDLSRGTFGNPAEAIPTIEEAFGLPAPAPAQFAQHITNLPPMIGNIPPEQHAEDAYRVRPNLITLDGWSVQKWNIDHSRWLGWNASMGKPSPVFPTYGRAVDALFDWSDANAQVVKLFAPSPDDVGRWAKNGFDTAADDDVVTISGTPEQVTEAGRAILKGMIEAIGPELGISNERKLGQDCDCLHPIDIENGVCTQCGGRVEQMRTTVDLRVIIFNTHLYGVEQRPVDRESWYRVGFRGVMLASTVKGAREIGDAWAKETGTAIRWVTDNPDTAPQVEIKPVEIRTVDMRIEDAHHNEHGGVYVTQYRETVIDDWKTVRPDDLGTHRPRGYTTAWSFSIVKAQEIADAFCKARGHGEVPRWLSWPNSATPAPQVGQIEIKPVEIGTRVAMLTNADGFYSVLEWGPNAWTTIAEELTWEDAEARLSPEPENAPAIPIGSCEIRPGSMPGDCWNVHIWDGGRWKQIAGDVTRRTAEGVVRARANDPENRAGPPVVTMIRIPKATLDAQADKVTRAREALHAILMIVTEAGFPRTSFNDVEKIDQIAREAIQAIDNGKYRV